MKVQSIGLQTKDPRTLGPIIERIIYFHEKNQQKQIKAKSATNILTLNHEKSKKKYEDKVKQKQTQIIKRLDQIKKARATFFKKQSQHIQKVLIKCSNDSNLRRMNKLEKINQRNLQHEKVKHESLVQKCETIDFFNLTQQPQTQLRTVSNSLNVSDAKLNKYKKIYDLCEQIRKKSQQKQQKADSNRRMFQDRNKIKELNENKLVRKIRADEQFLLKENTFIKKSVSKLETSSKRSEQHSMSERKKSQQKRQKNNKSLQKIRKNRTDLEAKLEQRLANLDKQNYQKQKRNEQNKQNLVESLVSNKKSTRLLKAEHTMTRFHQSMEEFNTRMSDMYKRDREQWGFLTKVNQFKDILIEKNIYENHQLCLNK